MSFNFPISITPSISNYDIPYYNNTSITTFQENVNPSKRPGWFEKINSEVYTITPGVSSLNLTKFTSNKIIRVISANGSLILPINILLPPRDVDGLRFTIDFSISPRNVIYIGTTDDSSVLFTYVGAETLGVSPSSLAHHLIQIAPTTIVNDTTIYNSSVSVDCYNNDQLWLLTIYTKNGLTTSAM